MVAELKGTFLVTWSFGTWRNERTWRSMPFPFGLVDVGPAEIHLRSWYWSWWLPERVVARDEIRSVKVGHVLGASKLEIEIINGPPVILRSGFRPKALVESFCANGYPIA